MVLGFSLQSRSDFIVPLGFPLPNGAGIFPAANVAGVFPPKVNCTGKCEGHVPRFNNNVSNVNPILQHDACGYTPAVGAA